MQTSHLGDLPIDLVINKKNNRDSQNIILLITLIFIGYVTYPSLID